MSWAANQTVLPREAKIPEIVYDAIFRGIDDPFNVIDTDYRIIWANAGKARLCGRSQADLIGKLCYEMYQKRREVCPQCPVAVAFSSGKTCVVKRNLTMPSGSKSHCEIRAYPVHDSFGKIICGITIGFDLSGRGGTIQRDRPQVCSKKTGQRKEAPFAPPSSALFGEETFCDGLTDREIEVLHLVATGLTNNDIATTLGISPHTVKSHITHIFNKLGVSDRTQAAIRGTHLGLI